MAQFIKTKILNACIHTEQSFKMHEKNEMKEEIDKTTIIVGDSCLNNT